MRRAAGEARDPGVEGVGRGGLFGEEVGHCPRSFPKEGEMNAEDTEVTEELGEEGVWLSSAISASSEHLCSLCVRS